MADKAARPAGHFHAVRFYEDDASLCRIVCDFIYKDAAYEEICREHTHILSVQGEAAPLH